MELAKAAALITEARVMALRPSDFLVFHSAAALSVEQMGELHAYLEAQTGHGRILIVDRGAEIAVLRREGAAEADDAAAGAAAEPVHRPISQRPTVAPSGHAPGCIAP